MAAVATQAASAIPQTKFEPILDLPKSKDDEGPVKFDSKKHLAFKEPSGVLMMKDLGYAEDSGVSPVAVSQPFQLFSESAINEMRSEIFNPEIMRTNSFKSNINPCMLRGYAAKYAPFTYDAWQSPETLAILSKIAGVDLIPAMDFEVAHINLAWKTEEQTKQELETISKQKRYFADDEGIGGCPWEDDKPIVGWHVDSYPFVCVTMLSDCTDMVGGETALRTADGNVLKVRGPGKGCAVVLQGRYITHQALRALGARERITSVTSFRPRSPHLKDDSVLTTVRGVSHLSELYYEFGEYRLEMLQERIQARLKQLRGDRRANRKFATADFKAFLKEQEAFLTHTETEIVQDEEVVAGHCPEMDIPDVVVRADDQEDSVRKRTRVE